MHGGRELVCLTDASRFNVLNSIGLGQTQAERELEFIWGYYNNNEHNNNNYYYNAY